MGEESRWQTTITSLKQGIHHIYDTKEFSDVVFKLGQRHFRAHRLILAARSSELARILLDPNAVDEVILEDESVTETGFEILLRFIYKDTIGTEDKQSIVEAYLSANYYNQKALKNKCEEKIDSWSITIHEVCTLLNVSLNIPRLKERCLNFIKDNACEIIASPSFLNLSFNSLKIILENAALEDVSVMECITRIMEWGANRHTSPVNYALVREDFLSNDPPLLGLLKFEALSLDNFANIVGKYKGLLTPVEVLNFMEYYSTKDTSVLPPWSIAR